MTVKEIIQTIELVAPKPLQESYDNSGMQVGDIDADVSSVSLCIDVTEKVIDEAIALGCGLVISHHPLIFQGLKSITGKNYIERILIKAIKNNINIYSAHTNLDNAVDGVNFEIASRLNLKDVTILDPKVGTDDETGSGVTGLLEEPVEYIEFLERVKELFGCGCIQYSGSLGKKIKRVALCGGSAAFLIPQAIRANADIYITGEIKYHDYFGNDEQIMLASIGHYESEQYTAFLIESIIKRKYPDLTVHVTKVNTNPINYL